MPILRTCLIICLAFAAAPVSAQDKSVRPGINKSFQNPNVARYVERFEREGREVYDHREKIIGECRIKPGMVVADIGAGTGLFTRLIAKQTGPSGKVLAVDISKKFVDHVTASCEQAGLRNVQGIVCTSESSALPPNSIDVAFICDVYHHFEFPYKSMRSIRNALKPGGRVVVVDFHRQEGVSSEFILKHVRADQETFVSEIHLAGFTTSRELKFLKTSYWMEFTASDRKTDSGHTVDTLEQVRSQLKSGVAAIIDVREPGEWRAGHLDQTKLVPLSVLRNAGDRREELLEKHVPQGKIIYCHCRSGGRVLSATKILEELGYDIRPLRKGYAELKDAGF